MGRLDGAVVLVTGASRGLGRALSVAVAREGGRPILVSRDRAGLDETARRVRADGQDPIVAVADIADPAAVRRLRAVVDDTAHPTALINNAGQFLAGRLTELSLEEVAGAYGTGVTGTALVTSAFLADVKADPRGLILNIGARAAAPGRPLAVSGTSIPYQTAKRHLTLFSAALRAEEPGLPVANLYLPAIGSLADLDDPPGVLDRLYPNMRVVPLTRVAAIVVSRLAGEAPLFEEWVLPPA